MINPFIVIDIGGATTDVHYSKDLVRDNILGESGYDRVVFKKLGVYKSKENLIFSAKNNEFVYELLNFLNVTEQYLRSRIAQRRSHTVLMQLSIFLVLHQVSTQNPLYITLNLHLVKSIVFNRWYYKGIE